MKRQAYAKKRDLNEPEIIKALKKAGCTVKTTNFVDIVVGHRGFNYLFEIKNPEGKNNIEESQQDLLDNWRGQYDIIHTAEDALLILGIYK